MLYQLYQSLCDFSSRFWQILKDEISEPFGVQLHHNSPFQELMNAPVAMVIGQTTTIERLTKITIVNKLLCQGSTFDRDALATLIQGIKQNENLSKVKFHSCQFDVPIQDYLAEHAPEFSFQDKGHGLLIFKRAPTNNVHDQYETTPEHHRNRSTLVNSTL